MDAVSKASEAVEALLDEARTRQSEIDDRLRKAERALVRHRNAKGVVDAEVRELEADLAALQRRPLRVVTSG